jgi:uncharacterized protein YecE (DUF72 family)
VSSFYRISSLPGYKCGFNLFQLPASYSFDAENSGILAQFVSLLDSARDNVIEFRYAGWWNRECFELLLGNGICFCAVDGFSMPEIIPPAGDIACFRFYGTAYGGDYPDKVMQRYAREIENISCRRVYAYFNKDAEARAVFNARLLSGLVSQPSGYHPV